MDTTDINEMKNAIQKGPWRKVSIIAAGLILLFSFKPWVQVGAGERGIVQNFGAVQNNVLNEGIHFRIPIMQICHFNGCENTKSHHRCRFGIF
jgi:hypothetical protein